MKIDADGDFELFEASLEGNLKVGEKETFQERLTSDPDFAARYQQYIEVVASLKARAKVALKEELRQIYQDSVPPTQGQSAQPTGRKLRFLLPFAAAILLLVVASFGLYSLYPGNSSEHLFHSWYRPFPAPPQVRSLDLPSSKDAFSAYQAGDYSRSESLFQVIVAQDTGDPEPILYQANCLLALGNGKTAIALLSDAQIRHDSLSRAHFDWYLAMAWLLEEDNKAARELLIPMSIKPGVYQSDARGILSEMK